LSFGPHQHRPLNSSTQEGGFLAGKAAGWYAEEQVIKPGYYHWKESSST